MVQKRIQFRRDMKNRDQALSGGDGFRPFATPATGDGLAAKGKGKGKGHKGKGKGSGKKSVPGECRAWFGKGACPRGGPPPKGQCPHTHDPSRKGAGKSRPPKAAPWGNGNNNNGGSTPRGRSQDRGKGTKPRTGKSPSGEADKGPCWDFLKHKCTRGSDCRFWHPGPCFDLKKTGKCKDGDKCCFLHSQKDGSAFPAPAAPQTPKKKKKKKKKSDTSSDSSSDDSTESSRQRKQAKKDKKKAKRAKSKERKKQALIAQAVADE
jgi:hypothetical protein